MELYSFQWLTESIRVLLFSIYSVLCCSGSGGAWWSRADGGHRNAWPKGTGLNLQLNTLKPVLVWIGPSALSTYYPWCSINKVYSWSTLISAPYHVMHSGFHSSIHPIENVCLFLQMSCHVSTKRDAIGPGTCAPCANGSLQSAPYSVKWWGTLWAQRDSSIMISPTAVLSLQGPEGKPGPPGPPGRSQVSPPLHLLPLTDQTHWPPGLQTTIWPLPVVSQDGAGPQLEADPGAAGAKVGKQRYNKSQGPWCIRKDHLLRSGRRIYFCFWSKKY